MVPSTPPPAPPRLRVPGDIQPDPDGRVRWWKPSWGQVVRHLGLGWLYLVPLLLLLVLSVAAWIGGFFALVFAWGFKLWGLLIGAAVAAAAKAISVAVHARREPFCIHCGYSLVGLPPEHVCPECGRPYSFELIRQYQENPSWFVQRWKTQRETRLESLPIEAGPNRIAARDGT